MGNFKDFLLENPDRISDSIFWRSKNSLTFGYINNKFFISKETTNHPDFAIHLLNTKQVSLSDFPEEVQKTMDVSRSSFKYPGRLWTSPDKILAFWQFPSKLDFNKLLEDLKKKGINVDDSWKVDTDSGMSSKLVPISEYTDKFKNIKVQNVEHVVSPMMKTKDLNKIPKQSKLQLPKNMTQAKYNSLRQTSESVNESFEDELQKQKTLEYELNKTSEILNKIPGIDSGPMGLTPDHIRNSSEWKTAKRNSDIAFQNLRNFNQTFVKRYKKELKVMRDLRDKERQKKFLKEDVPTSIAPSTVQNGIHVSKLGDVGRRSEGGKFKKFVTKSKKKKLKKDSENDLEINT